MSARTSSTAVMARRVEPASSLDYFPTPPWATRAFCEHVLPRIEETPLDRLFALEPACGEGHMALALSEYFFDVAGSDIFDYGFGYVTDFVHPDHCPPDVDWIITNPPFNLAQDFIVKSLRHARRGVAMLVRLAFLESDGRYDDLFSIRPPHLIALYSERVPMHRGRWVFDGSTATAYCWLVWRTDRAPALPGSAFVWIPKSRRVLKKHDDWLRYSGCQDLPKTHRAMVLQEKPMVRQAHHEGVPASPLVDPFHNRRDIGPSQRALL